MSLKTAGQRVCEPADLVSVKQLSLLTTSSEAEQVADHQPQASPHSLHGQQLLPTLPQAQELPGQDAAPGCR